MLLKRYKKNPIIIPDLTKEYEKEAVYNPCAIVHNNEIYLIYRAVNSSGISSLCLAISKDGYNFKKYKGNPIIKPSFPEEKQGCEDPRITKIRNSFYLTYTAYDGKYSERGENICTALAVSKDLFSWKKKGIIAKDRQAVVLNQRKAWAEERGLDTEMIEKVFKLLIDKNIQIQIDIFKSNNK